MKDLEPNQTATASSPQQLKDIPPPHDPARGYWRAMQRAGIAPEWAWPMTFLAVARCSQEPPASVRAFLDSRMGEELALQVIEQVHTGVGLGRAVRHVVESWMRSPLDELAQLVYHLSDLPLLVGWIRIMQR